MNAVLMEPEIPFSCCDTTGDESHLPAVAPLVALLRQLTELIGSMTDGQYAQKPVGLVPSSIGGHVRHSLDHLSALLNGAADGELDYDRRERGTDVERCRAAALALVRHL